MCPRDFASHDLFLQPQVFCAHVGFHKAHIRSSGLTIVQGTVDKAVMMDLRLLREHMKTVGLPGMGQEISHLPIINVACTIFCSA